MGFSNDENFIVEPDTLDEFKESDYLYDTRKVNAGSPVCSIYTSPN